MTAALTAAGELPDTAAGWRSYADYLAWQAAEGPAGKNRAYVSMTQGWALGTPAFKQALLLDHASAMQTRAWTGSAAREVKTGRWEQALAKGLARIPKAQRESASKSAPWKVALARHLKETTDVSNGWLAEQLQMGSHVYVSKHVGLLRRSSGTAAHRIHAQLDKKDKR